ncbi:MAG: tripartite tricarboxylate transporter substrate binding protein [Alphaproteobacteria bacterium]|nr:tripartite tricarboxylate transporter substrate binding protein [Alphaproteobacteria bacterium]
MNLTRRTALVGLGGALIAQPGLAQAPWPSQPLKIVVPFPPGALTDVLGRMVAERLQAALGQPVVVDNKPGAATQVGAAFVAKQPADGYTLLVATSTTLGIVPFLYAKPLIAITDFTGVALLGNVTFYLVVRPNLPAKSLPELVALLRSKPDGYSYASPGAGTAHHLLVELIRDREKLQVTHIPYQGSAKALVDLSEGRLDFMFLDASVALPQIAAGKVVALAVTGNRRDPAKPDIPALTELYPGLGLQAWQSIVAPAGTPAPVVERLNREINVALTDPPFGQRLRQVGVEPLPLTVKAFDDFIRNDAGRWAALVKMSGAKAD